MILLQKVSGKLLFNISIECYIKIPGFPAGSAGKESACNAGDLSSIHVSAMILEGSQENPGGQVKTPFNEEKRLAVLYAAYC